MTPLKPAQGKVSQSPDTGNSYGNDESARKFDDGYRHYHGPEMYIINQFGKRYPNLQVRIDQQARAGQPIARTGMTGFTYIPHLHFHIFIFKGGNIWTDFDTLAVDDFAVNWSKQSYLKVCKHISTCPSSFEVQSRSALLIHHRFPTTHMTSFSRSTLPSERAYCFTASVTAFHISFFFSPVWLDIMA